MIPSVEVALGGHHKLGDGQFLIRGTLIFDDRLYVSGQTEKSQKHRFPECRLTVQERETSFKSIGKTLHSRTLGSSGHNARKHTQSSEQYHRTKVHFTRADQVSSKCKTY